MPDYTSGNTPGKPGLEELDEAECLRLISPGGIGRIAYSGRTGVTVLPVNYQLHHGAIVFRTAQDSPLDEDLRTGIANAEYKVGFEIDDFDLAAREGWSVLIQGSAHHVDSGPERAAALEAGVEPWPGGDREQFLRILPTRISGRRIRRTPKPAPGTSGASGLSNTLAGPHAGGGQTVTVAAGRAGVKSAPFTALISSLRGMRSRSLATPAPNRGNGP